MSGAQPPDSSWYVYNKCHLRNLHDWLPHQVYVFSQKSGGCSRSHMVPLRKATSNCHTKTHRQSGPPREILGPGGTYHWGSKFFRFCELKRKKKKDKVEGPLKSGNFLSTGLPTAPQKYKFGYDEGGFFSKFTERGRPARRSEIRCLQRQDCRSKTMTPLVVANATSSYWLVFASN